MAKTAVINIRTEPEIKQEIEELFSQFGITVSDAVNIFFRKSLMDGGIPFPVNYPNPNAETLAAIREAEEMIKTGSGKIFNSVEELFMELDS